MDRGTAGTRHMAELLKDQVTSTMSEKWKIWLEVTPRKRASFLQPPASLVPLDESFTE